MSVVSDDPVVQVTSSYRQEADTARVDRMRQNEQNYDAYHLRSDTSHKIKGQSREFLPRQAMAIEQICTFFAQGLLDLGDWFSVDLAPGILDDPEFPLTAAEVKKILSHFCDRARFIPFVADALKSGLLGSLMVCKVDGEYVPSPQFYVEQAPGGDPKKPQKLKRKDVPVWVPRLSVIRQQDYYPDPTGRGLYELQDIWMDFHEVRRLSEGDHAYFDPSVVESLRGGMSPTPDNEDQQAREKGQNSTLGGGYRKQVKITECYGTILDPATGDILHENVCWAIANDTYVIRKPEPIEFWHGKSPILARPIIRVPGSVWHKSLMDSATRLNLSLNEFFNLILDGGISEVYGIKQLRTDWLEDESEVSDGIPQGSTLKANTSCPPGQKVLERVDTGTISPQAMSVFQLASAELNQSAMTNDLRMGAMPSRAVKATEVVEASNTLTSVFTGMVKVVEDDFLSPLLEMLWLTCLQNADGADTVEIQAILGKQKAEQLAGISPEERFAALYGRYAFKVNGVTRTLNKMKDFRKLTAFLQTVSTSEVLLQAFAQKYDFGKLLGAIARSLDVDTDEIAGQTQVPALAPGGSANPAPPGAPGGAPAGSGGGGGGASSSRMLGTSGNTQSNIPQAAGPSGGGESGIPHAHFPPSPASGV